MRRTPLVRTQPEARTSVPVLRPKKCKGCGERFRPWSSTQTVCGRKCAEMVAPGKAKKEQAKKDRAKLLELKPLSHHHSLTKDAVNAYIRARDADRPCISCDRTNASEWHAGHYMSVGSESALRYDPANIHKQCSHCNVHKGSNAIQYRIRLVRRIGVAEVERLEGPQPVIKWTREGLAEIRKQFSAMKRELEKRNA